MADPAPVGSDVQAGTYLPLHELRLRTGESSESNHFRHARCAKGSYGWEALSGGTKDPYPGRK